MPIPAEAASRLAEALTHLESEARRCVKDSRPDPVHDVRVAIRRLDQMIEIFAEWLPGKPRRKIRARLDKILDATGDVRDADIALEQIKKLELKPDEETKAAVVRMREEASAVLLAKLNRTLEKNPPGNWQASLELETTGDGSLAQFAAAHLPDLAGEFIEAGTSLADHPKSRKRLHSFRLASKRFRYSLEPFAEFYGPELEQRIDAVRKIQTALGDLQDCVATRRMLRELGMPKSDLEPLKDQEKKRLKKFRNLWPKLFAEGAGAEWQQFLGATRAAGKRKKRTKGTVR